MTSRVDEHDLLAWIEGELTGDELPPDRLAAVEAAIAADPALRRFALGAREDRETLRRLTRGALAAAPEGLLEEAIARAERDALLAPPVLAKVGQARSRPMTTRRFALAASIGIAIGVFAGLPILMTRLNSRPGSPGNALTLAPERGGAEEQKRVAEAPADSMAQPSQPSQEGALALAPADGNANAPSAELAVLPSDRVGSASAIVADADEAVGRVAPSAVAGLDDVAKDEPPMSGRRERLEKLDRVDGAGDVPLDVAVALAQSGRLAIIVEGADAGAVEGWLRALPDGRELAPRRINTRLAAPGRSRDQEADGAVARSMADAMSPRPARDALRPAVAVRIPATPGSIERLVRELNTAQGGGGAVRLASLDAGAEAPGFEEISPMWRLDPFTRWLQRAVVIVLPESAAPADPAQPRP